MNMFLRCISTLLLLLQFCVLSATGVASSLTDFDNNPCRQNAETFFGCLIEDEFLDEQIELSATASRDSLCATVWYWASEYFYDSQDFRAAERYGLQALPLCKAVGDKTMEADCASLLGLIYVRLGEFDKAAVYAKQCNQLDIESGDDNNIASSYNTLAGIYMSMRQPDEAERYILKAIEHVERTDNLPRKAVIYGMASEVYQHKFGDSERLRNSSDRKLVEKTLDYATRAWEIEKQLGRDDKAAIRQTQRAAALTVLERYDESEKALLEAIPVIEASGNYHSLGIAYNHLGDLYYVTGRNQEGADAYYKALDIFVAMHDIYNESHTRKGLRETLRGINPEEALLHGDRFEHLRDSIYDQETNRNLSHYAAEYDNDILQQINHRQKVRYIWLIVIILLLFALMAVVTWTAHRMQQKRQISHFNNLLTEVEKLRQQSRARKKLDEVRVADSTADNNDQPTDSGDNEVTADNDPNDALADNRLFLARVVDLVNSGLPRNEFSVEHIAGAMNMSISTFRRRMLAATGDSPKNFILAIQMEKATEMLTQQKDLQIADIALACGFSDAGSFTRTFRRFYGVTPSQYRDK